MFEPQITQMTRMGMLECSALQFRDLVHLCDLWFILLWYPSSGAHLSVCLSEVGW